MRNILVSLIILAAPTAAMSDTGPDVATMCDLLQHSTTMSLIAMQDMGIELSDLLIENWESGDETTRLHSKSVLDSGFDSFHEVLNIATQAQEMCSGHYEPMFVETIRELS